jgi:hypothetical protein
MVVKSENGNFLLGFVRFALFVLGSSVGVCGSLFGLIGTQAMTGSESTFKVFFMFGIYHVISWGLGGLIVAAGFRPKNRLRVAAISGFAGGGVIGALVLIILMWIGVGFIFYSAIVYEVLIPPAIGGATVLWALIAKPRLSWLRFNLRTLLIVVTVLAIPLGWVGWKRGQVQKERATIPWVEEMDGSVYDQSWFGTWFGLGEVRGVRLGNTQVSDLSPLAELKNLETLNLDNTQVSDLSSLAELKNLYKLHLYNTQVSDEQVQELWQALPHCEISHSIRDGSRRIFGRR